MPQQASAAHPKERNIVLGSVYFALMMTILAETIVSASASARATVFLLDFQNARI